MLADGLPYRFDRR